MTLDEITTKIISRLAYEAGSSSWWTSTEIDSYVNSLYSEIALDTDLIKKRSEAILTIASTANYDIPKTAEVRTVKGVLGIEYNGEPLDYLTINELDSNIFKWRSLAAGTPFGWYYERGSENKTFYTVPKVATADIEMYVDMTYIPVDLTSISSPVEPFTDGIVLFDGVMSIALGKSGGGRDLDRSDWYWLQFVSKLPSITKIKVSKQHSMKSIDEGDNRRGFRLGEHYPFYPVD